MNATGRTFLFVAVAAIAVGISMGVQFLTQPGSVEGFSEVGQEFFADFQDPLKARELSVSKFDSESSEVQSFTVKQNDDGLWVIPSHHNYPAEAAERLAKTAASLIGIRKVAIQTRSKDDWPRYGVADPSAEVVANLEKEDEKDPRGTRVALRDSSGNALVDLIIGFAVKGRANHYYVRIPDKNPVFVAKLEADLSAKFSDWIEPDLLKLNQADIVRIKADRYSIDEEQRAVVMGEVLSLTKDSEANKWSLEGMDAEKESLKDTVISDLNRNLDQMKIVGVRPKPKGINSDLTITGDVAESPALQEALQIDLMRQGYYIIPDDQKKLKLMSNEGELIAGTKDGLLYTLFFGEIARGSAKDLETGLNEGKAEAAKPEAAAEAPKEGSAESLEDAKKKAEEDAAGPRRYLLVKVEYDETLLGAKPTEPTEPAKPEILNEAAPAGDKPADGAKAEAPAAEAPKTETSDASKDAATPAPEAKPEAAPAEPTLDAPAPVEGHAAPKAEEKAAEEEAAAEKPEDPAFCDEPGSAAAVAQEPPQEPAAPAAETPAAETPAAAPSQETPAVEAANSDEAKPADPAAPATDAPTTPATATQDPSPVDPNAAPQQPAPAPQAPVDPKAEAQKQYDMAMIEYKSAKAAYERNLKAWEERATAGKKKADELKTRFEAWYYVISAESFEKLALSRGTLVGPKEAAPAEGAAPALPGGGGIPGFQLPGQN
jgi:hypothetical protein